MNDKNNDIESTADELIEILEKQNEIYRKLIKSETEELNTETLSIEEKLKKINKTEETENLNKE